MFSIGIYHPKKECNVGGLWRSAHAFGASLIFTIGRRYHRQSSDTSNASGQIPLIEYSDFEIFKRNRPKGSQLIGVELSTKAFNLATFCHPKNAVYLMGAEDSGVPDKILTECQYVLQIPTIERFSLNLATSGGIVMYDRLAKGHSRIIKKKLG